MPTTTTIKVPTSLRDRLAERARRDSVPLSVVIDRALEAAEERDFWHAVRAQHAAEAVGDPDEGWPLGDDLVDVEDDALSARDGW